MRPRIFRLLAIAALLGGAIVLSGCSEGQPPGNSETPSAPSAAEAAPAADAAIPSGVTVTGTGRVSVVPDRLDATFGVETQASTADEALSANADTTQNVIDALGNAGIEDEDIQTQQVSVYPRYSSDGQVIVGYSASNSVLAKIRELDGAGAVIDAAAAAGANQVYSLSFAVTDQDGPYRQALEQALEKARGKAETLAGAAGLELGAVTSIIESGVVVSPPVPYAADAAAEGASTTPIEPGLQEVQATVSVTYAVS